MLATASSQVSFSLHPLKVTRTKQDKINSKIMDACILLHFVNLPIFLDRQSIRDHAFWQAVIFHRTAHTVMQDS